MNDNLTVAEVAQKLSVSADTIRRWEKSGLIKSRRSENNYRLFNYNEAERVKKKLRGGSSSNGYKILKSTKKTNFNIIELFTGAGGTALGLENAGLVHELAVELDKNACKTIRSNRPHWNLIEDDIRNIDFKPWKGKVDIIEGGFPCQSFSYAGKGMGFGETRGTLFFEFARAIQETMPKIAVGENVKGLLKHDQGRTLDTMLKKLNEIGYRVGYKVLRSQYLDVPQKRERLIIIAVRNDLDLPILYPKEKDYTVSLREAFEGCAQEAGQQDPPTKKHILSLIPPGGYWRDLPVELH